MAARCFNCDGAGTTIFYPHVESVVRVDAGTWLLSPLLEWFEDLCPYCEGEADLDEPPPFGFNWI